MAKHEGPDSNRLNQMDRAESAYIDGMNYAKRHAQGDACDWCAAHDGEIIDILEVIDGTADHKNGHCTFTFQKDRN